MRVVERGYGASAARALIDARATTIDTLGLTHSVSGKCERA